jgi:hypothetical protein
MPNPSLNLKIASLELVILQASYDLQSRTPGNPLASPRRLAVLRQARVMLHQCHLEQLNVKGVLQ